MVIVFSLICSFSSVTPVSAQGVVIPVGGRALDTSYCVVPTGGILIVVGPPRPGVFLLQLGVTRTYLHFMYEDPAYQLGTADGMYECLGVNKKHFFTIGVGPLMLLSGTSMI